MGRLEGMDVDIYYSEEQQLAVCDLNGGYILLEDRITDECFRLNREEAIAVSQAILKHFDVDFNAYEENISEHYRAPTIEEMAKFLAENPNFKIPPKEVCDPDAPLTSELAQHFGEE